MTHKELMDECDMLNENINRMMVTKDPKELLQCDCRKSIKQE